VASPAWQVAKLIVNLRVACVSVTGLIWTEKKKKIIEILLLLKFCYRI